MNHHLGIHTEKNLLDEFVYETVAEGVSVVATEGDDEDVVGVILSGACVPTEVEVPLEAKLAGLEGSKFAHVISILDAVDRRANGRLFSGGVDTVFDMKALSTERSVRLAGIATHMVRQSMEVARANGYRRIKCEATSKSLSLFNDFIKG